MANYFHQRNRWGTTNYYAISDKGDKPDQFGDSRHPYAQVTVHTRPARASANFNFSDEAPIERFDEEIERGYGLVNKELGFPDAQHYIVNSRLGDRHHRTAMRALEATEAISPSKRRVAGIAYAKGMRDLKNSMSQMFTDYPQENTVQSAFSHSTMRHAVPVILAHAHQNLGDLTASEDLSEHSSRMVKRAREKGFPVAMNVDNPNAVVTNDYTFDDDFNKTSFTEPTGFRKLSNAEVRSAKMHIRTMRGKSPKAPAHMSPQFEQLRLPGME
jgi:hypothetical protein